MSATTSALRLMLAGSNLTCSPWAYASSTFEPQRLQIPLRGAVQTKYSGCRTAALLPALLLVIFVFLSLACRAQLVLDFLAAETLPTNGPRILL
jgi:hypothetical protein